MSVLKFLKNNAFNNDQYSNRSFCKIKIKITINRNLNCESLVILKLFNFCDKNFKSIKIYM